MSTSAYGGRPKRKPEPGERVHLGFRVTPKLKRDLEKAAERNGRSISAEAELRMESTFSSETVIEALERSLGGPEMRHIAVLMAAAFTGAGWRRSGGRAPKEWLTDKWTYLQAVEAVVEALILQGPPATLTDLHLWLEGLKGRLAGPFVVDKETAPSSSTREVTSEGPFAAARQKFMAPEI